MEKTKVGIVGCGDISGIYLANLTSKFANTQVVGIYDIVCEKTKKAAAAFGIQKTYKELQELINDPEIDIVLNLTRPYQHYEVTMASIAAGKHVYSEKPLGACMNEAEEIKQAAANKGVCVGGAPDTFLGAGLQTCRKLIDDGFIGKPIAATAFFACAGHETWNPDPGYFYQRGGGPVLDAGPYYVTALINLLGPVASVSAVSKKTYETRMVTTQQNFGRLINVETDTHTAGALTFECGAICTMIMSYDIHAHNLPVIEIYGTEGTLSVPDPNIFAGPVKLFRREQKEFLTMPLMFGYSENCRGLGLADMAHAIKTGRKARAGIDLLYHAMEVMTGFLLSSSQKRAIDIMSRAERPAPMLSGLLPGKFE